MNKNDEGVKENENSNRSFNRKCELGMQPDYNIMKSFSFV